MMNDQTRYDRQMILPEIGAEGQAKIGAASVLCIGAGGLGAPALLYLAAAGVGRLGVADFDVVEVSNLQRQVIYKTDQEGQLKIDAARAHLEALNPDIKIDVFSEAVNAGNVSALMQPYDFVIDGTDNFAAKFLINDAAMKFGKTLIYGAVSQFEGQVAVFDGRDEHGACYRCLFPHPPEHEVLNCAEAGVLGPVAGMVGVTQAMQVLLLIVGDESFESLCGKLWRMDARTMRGTVIDILRDLNCAVCSGSRTDIVLSDDLKKCEGLKMDILSYEDVSKDAGFVLIDVREVEEYEAGFIPGAINVPLSKLLSGDGFSTVCDLGRRPVFYCQKGMRAQQAVAFCQGMGVENAACLAIHYGDWGSA